MISESIRHIANQIGEYFLDKNKGKDCYSKTELELLRIGISSIVEQEDGKIAITAARVGILIGKRGQTIDELQKRLGKPIKIIEEQDPLICHLMPDQATDDDWDYSEDWADHGYEDEFEDNLDYYDEE